MPSPTPMQKIEQVKMFGEDFIDIVLIGDTFDDAYSAAIKQCQELGKTFIHPFNDPKVIEGQATIALELLDQKQTKHRLCFFTCRRWWIGFRFISNV